jgi:hypothetical protein
MRKIKYTIPVQKFGDKKIEQIEVIGFIIPNTNKKYALQRMYNLSNPDPLTQPWMVTHVPTGCVMAGDFKSKPKALRWFKNFMLLLNESDRIALANLTTTSDLSLDLKKACGKASKQAYQFCS